MSARARPDLAVVGAGPAGLAAAAVAARAGLSVLLLDEQPAPGGQVWRNAEAILAERGPLRRLASHYGAAKTALARLSAAGVAPVCGATLVDVAREDDDFALSWLSRDAAPSPRLEHSRARALVVATGAQERAPLFPGAHLPGVMGVGALQSALKQSGIVPADGGLVIAGQGPLPLLLLAQIGALGGRVAAVLDTAPTGAPRRGARHLPAALASDPLLLARGAALIVRRLLAGVPVYRGVGDLVAQGERALAQVRFESGGRHHAIPASLLAFHDGVVPNTQITRLLDLPHRGVQDLCGVGSRIPSPRRDRLA